MRALVTGGGGRVGAAIATALGEMGYGVAVHYASSAQGAATVADSVRRAGQQAVTLKADLLDLDACEALVPRAVEALGGPLTVLVNNASIFEHDDIETATRDSWNRHMVSNLQAPFLLTQHFARQAPAPALDPEPLAQANVINLIDQRVRKLTPEFMTYTLAKSALWTLTQTTAQGLAPKVRVNAIGPGPTLRGGRQSEEHFAAQRAATVLQRGSDPGGIVEAMRYLLGASAVTGQLICVDGGQHLAWQTPDVLGVE